MPSNVRRQVRVSHGGSTLTDREALAAFKWTADGAGCLDHLLDGPCFPTERAARAAWPRLRRACWARAHRFQVPASATFFDQVTAEGWSLLFDSWQHDRLFDLAAVRAALARDRQAVQVFRDRDPSGATSIADFLDSWLSDLDVIEHEAVRIGAAHAAGVFPQPPPRISSAQRYDGGAQSGNDDAA